MSVCLSEATSIHIDSTQLSISSASSSVSIKWTSRPLVYTPREERERSAALARGVLSVAFCCRFGSIDDDAVLQPFCESIASLEQKLSPDNRWNRLLYLALPPSLFASASAGFKRNCNNSTGAGLSCDPVFSFVEEFLRQIGKEIKIFPDSFQEVVCLLPVRWDFFFSRTTRHVPRSRLRMYGLTYIKRSICSVFVSQSLRRHLDKCTCSSVFALAMKSRIAKLCSVSPRPRRMGCLSYRGARVSTSALFPMAW